MGGVRITAPAGLQLGDVVELTVDEGADPFTLSGRVVSTSADGVEARYGHIAFTPAYSARPGLRHTWASRPSVPAWTSRSSQSGSSVPRASSHVTSTSTSRPPWHRRRPRR